MLYNYICNTCLKAAEAVKGSPLDVDEIWEVMFETSHAINPTKKELKEARECPRCEGHDTERTTMGVATYGYIRGNCYLDRAGCRRDMDIMKLKTDDPYGEMREKGEAEDLAIRLKKTGQYNSHPKYFPQGGTTGPTSSP